VLELSLIAISKMLFLFIITSLFLADPVPDQYVVFGRIISTLLGNTQLDGVTQDIWD